MSTWDEIITMLVDMYHRNQQSTNLKYEVFGRLFCIEFIRVVSTSKEVTEPIKRLLKFFKSIKNVRYAINQTNNVGKNIAKTWLKYFRFIVIVNIK